MSFTIPNSFVQDTPAKAGEVNENFDAVQKAIESLEEALIPVGTVLVTAGSNASEGYLMCNGQAVSRTKYAALFGVIGGAFGVGDGGTTFNLPDMRGRVPVGVDIATLRNHAFVGLGQAGGNYWLQQHAHFFGVAGNTGGESAPHDHFLGWTAFNQHFAIGEQAANFVFQTGAGTRTTAELESHVHGFNFQGWTNNEGLGGSQNMPPFLSLNYMIKH